MEEEFETLLYHLGQDVGYMGLRVQKDVQKCLKDLRTNHDHKKFCDKLTDVLKKFSEYTLQYSKDLEGRITEYNKEEDYKEITQKLQKICGINNNHCNLCKCKEKGTETSNSLGPPEKNNDDESTELTKYELKNEVLSQCSLHLGSEDEIKPEQSTQIQSPVFQNKNVPTNDPSDTTVRISFDDATEQHSIRQEHNAGSASHIDTANIRSHDSDMTEQDDSDTDIANSLEISHSEEILSSDDQEEAVVCLSDEGDNPNMASVESETTEAKDDPVEHQPLSLKKAAGDNNSDELQKFDVIPLPYKPLFDKEAPTIQESPSSDADSISRPDDGKNASPSVDNTIPQKIDVIALPYKPLYKKEEKTVQESAGSHAGSVCSLRDKVSDGNYIANNESNNSTGNIENNYPDVEIVSVSSSNEERDSDVEIIEDISSTINVSDQSVLEPTTTDKLQDEIVDFADVPIKNDSARSFKAGESPNIDDIDFDAETVKNTSPQAVDRLKMSSLDASSEETIINAGTLPESQDIVDSDVETEKNNSNVAVVENVEENDGWDNETVANTPPEQGEAVDSDQDTVDNSPQHNSGDLQNSEGSSLAVPLEANDDITASQENYSEETVANCSPSAESSANDSDDTIIASPFIFKEKDANTEASNNTQSREIDSTSGTKDDKQVSDNDDDIYLKATQKIIVKTKEALAENDKSDSEEDFDAPSQVSPDKPDNTDESSKKSEDSACDLSVDNAKKQDNETNDNLISLVGEKAVETTEESPEEENQEEAATQDIGETTEEENQEEAATQDIEIPQNQTVPENEDVVMEKCNQDTHSQESYVFDLDDKQDLEVASVPATASDELKLPEEGSVAAPNGQNENVPKCDKVQEGDNLSISEFESGSDSDTDGPTTKQPKRNINDKDRKSLLKVIAEYFSKRKKEKEVAKESKDEELTKDNHKRRKNTSVKSRRTKEAKKLKPKDRVKTKREKKTSSSGKGEKDAKEYLEFLNASCSDEASNSSADSGKDNVNIQEDSSESSDVEATQIENFDDANNKETSTTQKTSNERSDELQEEEKGGSKEVIEASASDHDDSDNSEELFSSSKKEQEVSRGSEEPVQSLSDFINQLPVKPSENAAINNSDDEIDDLELTLKVDLRKLRQVCQKNVDIDDIFEEPTQEVTSKNPTERSNDGVSQDIQDEQTNHEENDDSQVVSPFKRKVVRPLPGTLSDGEEVFNKELDSQDTDIDSQVVSPFKKKGVKRLHSSDESDSEPPKKSSDAKDSQESDVFDCPTQKVVIPFKRINLKRLLSTEDEDSDAAQKPSDNEESDIDRGRPKRRKVQGLSSSEQNSLEELVTDENKEKELNNDQIDTEKDQETPEENDRDVEPSQFKLDDKARDDFLDMFDQDWDGAAKESVNEETVKAERNRNSENEDETLEASQFRLCDGDRDNLLNLLTDKENDERSKTNEGERVDSPSKKEKKLLDMLNDLSDGSEKSESDDECNISTIEPSNTCNKKDGNANQSSQSKLNTEARDELLDLSSNDLSDDSRDSDDKQKDNNDDRREPGGSQKVVNKDGNSEQDSDRADEDTNTKIEPSQFKLNSADRDELLDMLSNEQREDSRAQDESNENSEKKKKEKDSETQKSALNANNEETECSQFKLNDKARDDFLDMLSNDRSDNAKDKKLNDDSVARLENDKEDTLSDEVKGDLNKNDNDGVMDVDGIGDHDGIDDTATENSQGFDDIDESEDDVEKDREKTEAKSLQFKLNENEEDELLNLLSDHIKQKEINSELDTSQSDSDKSSDKENKDNGRKKKRKKLKKVDKDMLSELLQEYENAVKDKVENGDMEFNIMDGDNEDANSDLHEDSGGDSDPVLFDLLWEEAVEIPAEGPRRTKFRNSSKDAWEAYRKLLKDNEELSDDDTSSDISNIDIDDLELDLSDQERKKKERAVNDGLKKKFNIGKELFIDVKQEDISGFDLSSLPRKGGQRSSKIDRLCDISNVLQKRKKPEKKRRKVKLPRLSPSVSSSNSDSSVSDSDSLSSTLSRFSDDSVCTNRDSTSNRDSPIHLSDDHAEQEKLANALWENIKNSSDDNSGWSSDNDASSDEDKRKRKKKIGKEDKKGKKKGSGGKEEDATSDDTSSGKSGDENDDGEESGDKEKKERDLKDADLDSSDEEDFVGVRKTKGAWKHDPLLKGCLTSDEESDCDSDGSEKKARTSARIRRKMRQIQGDSDGSNEKSSPKKDGNTTPTKEIDNSSDSDVEFVMEKQKTPKKPIVIDDDETEEDSPSKRGKGRRNIRALVEDDELAEATKKAKKEETDRIKRLQERERAKESFTQSQSVGSQLSEDESEPLILDVNEELQIKVHPKITKKLKPHQRSGIQFMWDSCYESVEQLKKGYEGSGCILAHCMGLGKTLQALGLIHTVFNYKQVTRTKHVLVVCPLSTVSNWRNEYKLAYKDIRHCNVQLYTIQDKKAARQRFRIVKNWWKNGGVLVMGYECFGLMTNDQKLEKMAQKILCNKEEMLEALVNPGPDLVICDEGHLLRNKQTQRNLALNKVATRRRVVLTGTPLQNNLLEYYYMVNFVKPNLLGTEKEFKTNFINPISNGQFEDSTAVDILIMKKRTHVLHKILNKTVQRVEDTELKQYLPELVDQALFVKLSDLQIAFYNTYLDDANARPVEYTAAGNISRKNFLGDIQVLRYICTHPDIVTIAKKSGKSRIREQDVIDDNMDEPLEDKLFSKGNWFKNLIPESGVKKPELGTKMMIAMGIVEEAIANNDKVLIFSQTHAEMDSLEFFLKQELNFKKGTDYNRMDGTISPEVRTHMCDTFNNKNNKRLRVFIMSTKVGGLGLNLTAANRVIIMNVNWNPSYDTQSVFRAFRFGQDKAVYVYRLIAIDTMEEKMYQRQVTKLAVAHRVVDKHQITRHYSAADIQEFYSARPTTEYERPLPNVPEDRILAKLIQKFQFLYKWHEHQALLANRPEEDLNEQQKNAAWEEFNKKAVEPPHPLPGMPVPQFVSVSNLLNQPGPSGIQNRINAAYPQYPTTFSNRLPTRRSTRLNKIPDRQQLLRAMYRYEPPKTLPVLFKQTPSGPKLVVQTHGRIHGREIPIRFNYTLPDLPRNATSAASTSSGRPLMMERLPNPVSAVDVNTNRQSVPVDRRDDAARKIQEINSLIRAQTTPDLVPRYNSTATNTFNTTMPNSHDNRQASRIDEINSIISASLSQNDAVSDQDWAEDGMSASLLSVNVPDEDSEE